MQDYLKCSTEFNRRALAMNSMLSKLDDDTLVYVVYKVKERIGRCVTLDREVILCGVFIK